MGDHFHLHEDDWGMLSLEAEENRVERARTVAEAAAHGEAHRAPDGVGWTKMFLAPEAAVPLVSRGITLAALGRVLGAEWRAVEKVTSGYSTLREDVPNGWGFRRESAGAEDVLYGTCASGVLESLNIVQIRAELAPTLHDLGVAFRLILVDLWSDVVVDLADRGAVDDYVALG